MMIMIGGRAAPDGVTVPVLPKKNREYCTCVSMFSDPNNLRFRHVLSHVPFQRRSPHAFLHVPAGYRVPKTTSEVRYQ